MTFWLIMGCVFVAILVGMWLYAGYRERHRSEFEREMAKFREATEEMAEALGDALRPALQNVADAVAKVAEAFKR